MERTSIGDETIEEEEGVERERMKDRMNGNSKEGGEVESMSPSKAELDPAQRPRLMSFEEGGCRGNDGQVPCGLHTQDQTERKGAATPPAVRSLLQLLPKFIRYTRDLSSLSQKGAS